MYEELLRELNDLKRKVEALARLENGTYVHPNHTGDVTSVADGATTIAANAVTFAKMQNIVTDSLIGRDTAATGDPENITLGASLSMTGAGVLQRAALTGDVTAAANGNATTIANAAVTYVKMQNVSATDKLLGRSTAGAGVIEEIALTAFARTLIDDIDAAAGRTTLGLGTIATFASTAYIKADGTIALTAEWDIGEDMSIRAERLEARDAEGLRLEDDGGNLGIFINDGGNIGIGTADVETWHASYFGIHLSAVNAIMAEKAGDSLFLLANAYLDAAGAWKYRSTDEAAHYNLQDGQHIFAVAASGTADNTITWIDAMRIGISGNINIGPTVARGKLDVDQSSTTAAIPTLVLDQADLSEEFIEFVGTVGAGNSLELISGSGKTWTATHVARVSIAGVGMRFIQLGTFA